MIAEVLRAWKRESRWVTAAVMAGLLVVCQHQLASWQPQLIGYQSANPPPFDSHYSVAKISPNGRLLFMDDGKSMHACIWDLERKAVLCEFPLAHQNVVFAPDSKSVFFWNPFGDWNKGEIFSTEDGIKKDAIFLSLRSASYFHLSPNRGELLFLNGDCVWHADTSGGEGETKCPPVPVQGYSSLSSDGSQVILSAHGGVRIYDERTGQVRKFFPGLRGAVGFSPDTQVFWISDDRDHYFQIRDSSSGALLWKLDAFKAKFQFTHDSQFLALPTANGLELRKITTGEIFKRFPGPRESPFDISPDDSFAISCTSDGRILRWRLK